MTETEAPSMYERIGGAPTIRKMVERMYFWIKMDDQLWLTYFVGYDLATIKAHMVKLLSQLLGGPKQYDGRQLGEAHAHLHIRLGHYDRVRDYVLAALLVEHPPQDVLEKVQNVLASSRPVVCGVE